MATPSKQEYENAISGTAAKTRELATYYFMPQKIEYNDPKGLASPDFARKMANSTAAVEVVCSLVNSFGVMAGYQNYSSQMAISDLVFTLNTNAFWVQNASYLVPLMNAAVNAFLDSQELRLKDEPLWRDLDLHCRSCWLELLPAIMFCLKGYPEMRKVSLEMKQAFEPLLRSS
jgi:hypothetical protein